jgi:serine/threonine-protein kinase
MGVPFDLETLQITGPQLTLLPFLNVFGGGASQFAVSETGTLIYDSGRGPGGAAGGARLVEVDRDGVETPLPRASGALSTPRDSPNGDKIAYVDDGEIYIYDVVTGVSSQFTTEGGFSPMWSTDGEYLSFGFGPGGDVTVTNGFRRPADGREQATQVWDRAGIEFALDVGPGDSITVVQDALLTLGADLLLMRGGAGDAEFEDFLTDDWNETGASISPDGRWIAYQSDESGEFRIYVHSFPTITGLRNISPGLGTEPLWSPDGRELYYRSGSQFMVVDVTTEPTFEVLSVPELLFDEVAYATVGLASLRNWDVHPNGSRFLMVRQGGGGQSAGGPGGGGAVSAFNEVYLVTNWFEELRQRMGN